MAVDQLACCSNIIIQSVVTWKATFNSCIYVLCSSNYKTVPLVWSRDGATCTEYASWGGKQPTFKFSHFGMDNLFQTRQQPIQEPTLLLVLLKTVFFKLRRSQIQLSHISITHIFTQKDWRSFRLFAQTFPGLKMFAKFHRLCPV